MTRTEKSSIFPRIFGRWFVPGLIGLIILTCVSGFAIDAKGFLVNLIAGLCGIFLSILLALFIVDKYMKYQKEQEWTKVNKITLNAIAIHLCEIVGSLSFHFTYMNDNLTLPFFTGRNLPNEKTLLAFNPLLQALENLTLPIEIARHKSTSDIAVEYYEAMSWDMDQIQNVLTPRVMQNSTDQPLIDALIIFDNARRTLHHAIIVHRQVVTHGVFENVRPLIQSAEKVYQLIYENYR